MPFGEEMSRSELFERLFGSKFTVFMLQIEGSQP